MKKYILILSTIFIFSVSCKKVGSSTSAIVGSVDNKLYYYRLCKEELVCKFSCKDNDISSLSYENISLKCSNLESAFETYQLNSPKNNFTEKVEDLITNAEDATLLKVLDSNDTDLEFLNKRFDNNVNCTTENKPKICKDCNSYCPQAVRAGGITVWDKTIYHSNDMIIKANLDNDLGDLQWSKIMGEMSHEKAEEACKNYSFKYSDWYLPSIEDLEKASKFQLGDVINLKDTDKFVWSSTQINKDGIDYIKVRPLKQNIRRPILSKEINDKTELHYTICVRKY